MERRGEKINITELVEDGDMRRTAALHRSAAGFVLLKCWILAELTGFFKHCCHWIEEKFTQICVRKT
jgi:hypothetical protein